MEHDSLYLCTIHAIHPVKPGLGRTSRHRMRCLDKYSQQAIAITGITTCFCVLMIFFEFYSVPHSAQWQVLRVQVPLFCLGSSSHFLNFVAHSAILEDLPFEIVKVYQSSNIKWLALYWLCRSPSWNCHCERAYWFLMVCNIEMRVWQSHVWSTFKTMFLVQCFLVWDCHGVHGNLFIYNVLCRTHRNDRFCVSGCLLFCLEAIPTFETLWRTPQ